MRATHLSFILVTLSSILLSACGSEDKYEKNQSPYAQLNADIDNGTYLFNYNCSGCHGSKALGVIGPNIQEKKPEDIRWALENVARMDYLPNFTDQELVDIAAHLNALKQVSSSTIFSSTISSSRTVLAEENLNTIYLEHSFQYAKIYVFVHQDILIKQYQHSPSQNFSQLELGFVEFPIHINIEDLSSWQSLSKTLYSPTVVRFKK